MTPASGLSFWLNYDKRIDDLQSCDVLEIIRVARDQGQIVFKRRGSDNRVAELHAFLLAQRDGSFDDFFVERILHTQGYERADGRFLVLVDMA